MGPSAGRIRLVLAWAVVAAVVIGGWGILPAAAQGPENAVDDGETESAAAVDLPPAPEQELRAVWFHTYSPQDWDEVCRRLADHGFNALFVRVGRGGNVIYDSEFLPKDTWAQEAGVDELANVCRAAHAAGIQVHAWRVNYHMGSAPQWYRDRLSEEGRLSRDIDGDEAKFANPGDPRNAWLEYQVMMEMVEKYPIDGLHLDYIRYTEVPSYDFDYTDVSRREFERVVGRPVQAWPFDVRRGPLRLAYDDWMRSNIDDLVRRTALGVRQRRPEVMLSAAVWPRHRRYWTLIKQDWPRWVRNGWLDFVVPMDYSANDERFEDLVNEQAGVVDGNRPLAVGIGGWLLKSPEQLLRQIAVTRRHGAAGFVIFSYNADNIEEQLTAVRDHVATNDALPINNDVLLRVDLDGTLARRDLPRAAVAGSTLRALAGVSLRPGLRDRTYRIEAEVFWTDPATGARERLGDAAGRSRAGWRGAVTVPAGISQPWVRAVLRHTDGTVREVWCRGPLVEGLAEEEFAECVARTEAPRPPAGAGARVGVFQPGLGAERWVETFSGIDGLRLFLLHRLEPAHLAACDVVVLPKMSNASRLDSRTLERLRGWVRGGGTLVAVHDAVGFRLHPPPFAEIGYGDERVETTGIRVADDLAEKLGLSEFEHGYEDHLALALGDHGGRVLATDTEGRPVAIAARWGRGKVVLLGTIFGYPSDGEIPDAERTFVEGILRGAAGAL